MNPQLMSSLDDTARELRATLGALGDLAAIEGRLAVESVSLILVLSIGAGVLLVSAWLFFVTACVALTVGAPYALPVALAGAAAANTAAALLAWAWIQRLMRNLTFQELRARLAGAVDAAGRGYPEEA